MPRFMLMALAGLCLLGTGCLEITQEYTINPDGSGKAVLEQVAPGQMNNNAGAAANNDETARKMIVEQISKMHGVDAWENVSCEPTKDGKFRFRGTAYFPDINKMNPDGKDKPMATWDKTTLKFDSKMSMDQGAPGEPEKPLTEAEITAKIAKERAEYQQAKGFMVAMFTGLKVKMTFRLPGEVTATNVLVKDGKSASLSVTGEQMLAALEKVNGDDALMRRKVASKKSEDELMAEVLFGGKGDPSATAGGPQAAYFDYKAESTRAKAAEAEMFKKLGIELPRK